MKKLLAVAALFLLALTIHAPQALAQSGCSAIVNGAVLTAAQWNACFQGKQNTLGYTPVNRAGDSMTGKLSTVASGTGGAGFSLLPGVAPSAPANGDLWLTTLGIYARVNGSTVGPIGGSVTSVGLALPGSLFSVSGSPVTGSGTLTGTFTAQTANTVFAGPATGISATPTFRALVGADLPNPSSTTLGGVKSLASVSHNFLTQLSTGGVLSQAQPAFTDISGVTTPAQIPIGNGLVSSGGNLNVQGTAGEILAGATPALTYTPVLGDSSNAGTLGLTAGASNTTVTLRSIATASSYNFNFPTTPGTSGQPLLSGGGGNANNTWGSTSGSGAFLLVTGATASGLTLTGTTILPGSGQIDSSGRVGIGGAAYAGAAVLVLSTTSLSTTAQYGFATQAAASSSATTSMTGYLAQLSTAAAAFTVSTTYGFHANDVTLGAGSGVTSQYAFYADDQTHGSARNAGYYSAVSAAAGSYAFYGGGTAQSRLNGSLGLGMDPSNLLDAYQSSTGVVRASIKNDNAGVAAESMYQTSNGTRSIQMSLTGVNYSGAPITGGPSGELFYIYGGGTLPFVFAPGGVAAMTMDGTQHVLVGTAAQLGGSTDLFQVNGTVTFGTFSGSTCTNNGSITIHDAGGTARKVMVCS